MSLTNIPNLISYVVRMKLTNCQITNYCIIYYTNESQKSSCEIVDLIFFNEAEHYTVNFLYIPKSVLI